MIAWHALELQVLRDQLMPQGCNVLAPYSIGEQPLEIDAVVRSEHLFEHPKRTLWLLVHLFRKHTVLEIKSVAESFTIPKFQKFLGYSHLYLWKEELPEGALSAVALVTHVPEQVLASGKWKRLGVGFYQCHHGFLVSLVAINELPIRREYYSLLLLSSGKQRERFLKAILQAGDVYYLRYALLANSKEVLKMSEDMDVYLPMSLEENLQFLIERGMIKPEGILKYLSPEERLRGLGAEERLRGLGAEERLRGLGAEERLRGLSADEILKRLSPEERLRGLDAEGLRKLKQLLENLDSRPKVGT